MAAECVDCGAVLQYGEELEEKVCLSCQSEDHVREKQTWQEAALKLRQSLYKEHSPNITDKNWRDHNVVGGTCEVCKLLTATRWCMVYPPLRTRSV